jgi:predicted RNA binding protein YcfA (HicA-like mRNA interferase family)
MPELRNVRADDAIRAFERAGGIVRGGKGDHVNIKMPNGQIVTIPRTREPIKAGAAQGSVEEGRHERRAVRGIAEGPRA